MSKDTKKTDTKKAAAKDAAKETAKETAKATAKAAKETVKETKEAVKDAVKETAAEVKAPAAPKTAAPKAPAAPKAEKTCVKECFIEFSGKQIKVCSLSDKAIECWKADHKGEVSAVRIYVKPEESRTYYVINETDIGSFEI